MSRRKHAKAFTLVNPRGKMHVVGMQRAVLTDLYYFFIQRSWWVLGGFVVVSFLATNALYALLYMATGSGIAQARPDSFSDFFFFSVQTLSTIGYGHMYPQTIVADLLVTAESISGLVGFAMVTGLAFAKFSRPKARVIFSSQMVISSHDGIPTLMFRVANERANYIADATLHVVLVKPVTTAEGRAFTRMIDLKLVLNHSAMFFLTWTALHQITPDSPLYGESAATLVGSRMVIVCSLKGFDSTIGQTIHARHTYGTEHLAWGSRFRDILKPHPDGDGTVIDYHNFHAIEQDEHLSS